MFPSQQSSYVVFLDSSLVVLTDYVPSDCHLGMALGNSAVWLPSRC